MLSFEGHVLSIEGHVLAFEGHVLAFEGHVLSLEGEGFPWKGSCGEQVSDSDRRPRARRQGERAGRSVGGSRFTKEDDPPPGLIQQLWTARDLGRWRLLLDPPVPRGPHPRTRLSPGCPYLRLHVAQVPLTRLMEIGAPRLGLGRSGLEWRHRQFGHRPVGGQLGGRSALRGCYGRGARCPSLPTLTRRRGLRFSDRMAWVNPRRAERPRGTRREPRARLRRREGAMGVEAPRSRGLTTPRWPRSTIFVIPDLQGLRRHWREMQVIAMLGRWGNTVLTVD